ncbi:MAG: hypothetical protein JST40_10715 [Armatimonadetes bacterium]|nr:hypothetical protein [Armatimonadota bacterium]
MIWKPAYQNGLVRLQGMPALEGISLLGTPLSATTGDVVSISIGLMGLREQELVSRLYRAEFGGHEGFLEWIFESDAARSVIEGAIPLSRHIRVCHCEMAEEWQVAMGSLLPHQTLTALMVGCGPNSCEVEALMGAPTEDAWEAFAARIRDVR